jgi:hypothetical protein
MRVDDFLSDLIYIFNGIGQGDPLSMILYILYNVDLLEIVHPPEEEALGFVDDTLVMVEGKTFEDNVNALTDFMSREGGSFTWSDEHNSVFALDKLAVTHFTKKRVPNPCCLVIGMKNDIPWIIKFFIYYISNQNPILLTTGAVRIKSADYTC